ncbi:MAG: hypothetical protein FJW39_27740 [Acidobacteria bacterium]|nr:hypothetical protein [Acidobacteriota bacterium]
MDLRRFRVAAHPLHRRAGHSLEAFVLDRQRQSFRDSEDQAFPSDSVRAVFKDSVPALPSNGYGHGPASTELHYFIGAGLGKRRDHTAIVILVRSRGDVRARPAEGTEIDDLFFRRPRVQDQKEAT